MASVYIRYRLFSLFRFAKAVILSLSLAPFLLFPTHSFSSANIIEHCITKNNGSIVIFAVSDVTFEITDGRISASEGQSIRLLPGTHIRGDDLVMVSVVEREYQEVLAEETAKEVKKKTIESILKRREYSPKTFDTAAMVKGYGGTGTKTYLRSQQQVCAILPVRTPTSVIKAEILTGQAYSLPDKESDRLLRDIAHIHQPILAWGKRCETIAVMRT